MSLETFEFDGVRVTVDYDQCPMCPIEGAGTWSQGTGFDRVGRWSDPTDPEGVLRDVERLQDAIEGSVSELEWWVERLVREFGAQWWLHVDEDNELLQFATEFLEEALEAEEEINKKYVVTTYTYSGCGSPEFKAVADRKSFGKICGIDPKDTTALLKQLEGVAGEYAKWAEGDVYTLAFEYPSGDVGSVGNVCEDVTEEVAKWYALEYAPEGWDVEPVVKDSPSVSTDKLLDALASEGLDPYAINRVLSRVESVAV